MLFTLWNSVRATSRQDTLYLLSSPLLFSPLIFHLLSYFFLHILFFYHFYAVHSLYIINRVYKNHY